MASFGPKTTRLYLHCQHTEHKTSTLTEKKRALLVDRQVTETMVQEYAHREAV